MVGDASHAKETAIGEKDRVMSAYEEERKKREKELREKHQVVQLRKQMLERMRHREKMRNQLLANNGDFNETSMMANQNQLTVEKVEARNKIDVFENAFRKIKEATGVSDVNEVIQKIISQESSMENLISLTKENQAKIESLNENRRFVKSKIDEIKYSGVGGGHRRKLVDDHEDRLSNSMARLERSRLKYERLSKVIISMKGGVGHLQEKLEPIREELGSRPIELTDDTVAEVLRECEVCLNNVLRRVEASMDVVMKSKISKTKQAEENETSESKQSSLDLGIGNAEPPIRPYNQRITLSLDDEENGHTLLSSSGAYRDYDDMMGGGGGGGVGDDDEELTREKVKRASYQILSQVDRKKRGMKKKGKSSGVDMDDFGDGD